MRTKFFSCVVAVVGLALLAGCISTVDGRKEAGVPFSKDKVEGRYNKKPQELWVAAKDVLKYLGTLTGEDTARAVLEANIDTRTVRVKVEEVDSSVSRIVVQARTKGGAGDRELAGFVDKQIAVRLATGTVGTTPPGKRAY